MEEKLKRILIAAVLLLAAVLSFLILADKASAPETYSGTMAALDEKTETVLKLSAAAAVASAGVSAIPDDTATPIAEKLADFTEYFLLILCVLYAEKYLMTILGAGVFKILIPVALVLLGARLFLPKKRLQDLALKLIVVGVAAVLVIPASLRVSGMIDRSYAASLNATVEAAETLTEKTGELAEAERNESVIESVLRRISETVSTLTDKAADTLNRFVETLAVMIVSSCVIPLLVILFFCWLLKQFFGLDPSARALRRLAERFPSAHGGSGAEE